MTPIDRDLFHSQPARDAARAAAQVLDALQNHKPEAQAAGLAAAFMAICRRFSLHEGTAFEAVARMINDADAPEFRALKQYMDEEL